MMKKLLNHISMALVIALFLSISFPTYAVCHRFTKDPKELLTTEYEGIYVYNSGGYVADVGNGQYVSVDRIVLNIFNDEEYLELLAHEDISTYVKDQISEARQNAENSRNLSGEVVIFSNLLTLPSSRSITPYNYGGIPMGLERVYVYNITTQSKSIATGVDAWAIAQTIVDFTFIVGQGNVYISLLSNGYSVAQAFLNALGLVSPDSFSGSSTDFIEAQFTYNKVTQYTYSLQTGSPVLGLISHSITLIPHADTHPTQIRTYMFNSGSGTFSNTNLNVPVTQVSQYYNSPWAITLANIANGVSLSGMTDYVKLKIYNTLFIG